jgi:hypothetical protein
VDRADRQQLLQRLRVDAGRIADHFDLPLRSLEAEHPRVKSRYGVCYADGRIKVRLEHAKTGNPLRYSSLIDTVCHELAHLRHFDHGPEFKAFFWRLLGWARRQGIYRPRPRRVGTEPGGRAGTASAPARAASPTRRNGVPVFVTPERSRRVPWEPGEETRASSSPRSERPSPAGPSPRPALASTPAHEGLRPSPPSRQLSLFASD